MICRSRDLTLPLEKGPPEKNRGARPKVVSRRPKQGRKTPLSGDKGLKLNDYFWDLENATWRENWVAGGLGFEPRQPESESGVLPLDDPPTGRGPSGPPV